MASVRYNLEKEIRKFRNNTHANHAGKNFATQHVRMEMQFPN
jgi:hypothetical protein